MKMSIFRYVIIDGEERVIKMKLSGRTPLLRAINLEKKLKIKKIYIKLEGANPTHHKNARIAEVLCKDAAAHKKTTILVDGTNAYIRAIEYFAQENDLKIIIPRFSHETWKTYRFDPSSILDARKQNKLKKMDYLQLLAKVNNYYLAVEGYTNMNISLMALEELTKEIIAKRETIDTINTQFSHGYTLTSMYNVFLREWIEKEKSFPKIYCGINSQNELKTESLGHDIISYIQTNKSLLDSSKIALQESYGKIITVSEEELKEAKKLLRYVEQIKVSTENAYPLAAFLSQVKAGDVENGTHIIILDDARSRMDIEQITDFQPHTKEEILSVAKTYLAEYSDPLIEMNEALNNAIKKGFILLAKQNEAILGVCIIVNTQFDDFIPTYHLAYIGTSKDHKGRGIGTELVKRAVDITDGKLSLHVDLDNKGAKKLYEKMGFKHVYNRMIFYGE